MLRVAPSRRAINLWQLWEGATYPTEQVPPGSEAGTVAGVDLALADGDASAIFHHYCMDLLLSEDDLVELASLLTELPRAMPSLEGPARLYFEEALSLLTLIRRELDAR